MALHELLAALSSSDTTRTGCFFIALWSSRISLQGPQIQPEKEHEP